MKIQSITLLCLVTLIIAYNASAQKGKPAKETMIGSVLVTAPSGKKLGSIGSYSIKKILYMEVSPTAAAQGGYVGRDRGVVAATGLKTEDDTYEIIVHTPALSSPIVVRLQDDGNDPPFTKGSWSVFASSNNAVVIEHHEGRKTDIGGQTILVIKPDGTYTSINSPLGYGIMYITNVNCPTSAPGNQSYNNRIRNAGPFLSYSPECPDYNMPISHIICVGTGNVIEPKHQFDLRFGTDDNDSNPIRAQGCKLIGLVRDSETGQDTYHTIDPDTGD